MIEFVPLIFLTLLVGGWVMWPARATNAGEWKFSDEDTPLGRLAVRKEVLLGNIGDLDFEFAMGKLSEDDYRELRDNLKRQTLKIMEQIDVLLESEPVKAGHSQATLGACAGCGGELPPQARFCPHCGSSL